ncbi:MAG: UDP-N-acetylmuramoyl-L-alanyl-D-glutamate--2,6-diaminopimelate ligase [Deltaproteobacteria bacterium]|nr:UDP-N-acetylmuramoyl-L-alanyl-D-glutamate--2,6-diaminopimelate ligase [Deltaproteobacteria bacterium]
MLLKDLISTLGGKVTGAQAFNPDAAVKSVAYDSRAVKGEGCAFVAMRGEHADGHDFVAASVEKGAVCVIAERTTPGVCVPQIIVGDARAALSRASDLLSGSPSMKMTVVGVTGTNGKTTTTYLLESIFREAGWTPGVIGTVNYRYGGRVFDAPHTTPEAPELHGMLREMLDAGVTHCAMEVSSHALAQRRVDDCSFRAGVFTNLTHEHLDYHKTMEDYYVAKAVLFTRLLSGSGGVSVINADDPWGKRLAAEAPGPLTTSLSKGADIYPSRYSLSADGIDAAVETPAGVVEIASRLVGEYNLQNILGAIGAAVAVSAPLEAIKRGIDRLVRVPGRLEKLQAGGVTAYVDYAHTPDALLRALEALRRVSPGRVITVFGCGGNRDRAKRPRMGEVSARLSDVTIVTSDNPRDEEPLGIIAEVVSGISGAGIGAERYMVVPERGAAIRRAVEIARPGDTILVAGKGHENYQIIKGVKTPFDDMEELKCAVAGAGQRAPQGL